MSDLNEERRKSNVYSKSSAIYIQKARPLFQLGSYGQIEDREDEKLDMIEYVVQCRRAASKFRIDSCDIGPPLMLFDHAKPVTRVPRLLFIPPLLEILVWHKKVLVSGFYHFVSAKSSESKCVMKGNGSLTSLSNDIAARRS